MSMGRLFSVLGGKAASEHRAPNLLFTLKSHPSPLAPPNTAGIVAVVTMTTPPVCPPPSAGLGKEGLPGGGEVVMGKD